MKQFVLAKNTFLSTSFLIFELGKNLENNQREQRVIHQCLVAILNEIIRHMVDVMTKRWVRVGLG
ncbi:hypothetical protein K661_01707 [Piscirickettsia salmonis LF-89 = ATCC VR-1361]|nr:hypothetical protein [Piscirickettsia salmonis]ERL61941.1 hypothetical protein K661_01707 [Piscirickettsia salmonis LF-89 = ATCC VR-1361]